jgi:transposase
MNAKRYENEFKKIVINEVKSGMSMYKASLKYNVSQTAIGKWMAKADEILNTKSEEISDIDALKKLLAEKDEAIKHLKTAIIEISKAS